MVITDTEPQAKNKNRVSIFVDGEFYCGLELIVFMEKGFKKGMTVTESQLREAIIKSDAESAFKKAMAFAGIRMRSVHELKEYLRNKDYPDFIVDETVEKMKKYGYAGDREFVKHYVELYGAKRGVKRMREDLFRLGISEALISEALKDADQTGAAQKALERYLKTHPYDRRKAYAHLLSKGFESDVVYSVLSGGSDD